MLETEFFDLVLPPIGETGTIVNLEEEYSNFHPTMVRVATGDDIVEGETDAMVITSVGSKLDCRADVPVKKTWNRVRELDVEILLESEFGDHRVLSLAFHKGSIYVNTYDKTCPPANAVGKQLMKLHEE